MPEFNLIFIGLAFVAGLLTFLAPCTLPLIPGYLAFISGIHTDQLKEEKFKELRKKIVLNSLFFVIGFSIIFILFAAGASIFGRFFLKAALTLQIIPGILILIFALYLFGLVKIPFFQKGFKINVSERFKDYKKFYSLLAGIGFAVGWSPCIGPLLGSILTLVAISSTFGQGLFLLIIYSLGLGLPFILTAYFLLKFIKFLNRSQKILKFYNYISGTLLLGVAFLLITQNFDNFSNSIRNYFLQFPWYQDLINKFF